MYKGSASKVSRILRPFVLAIIVVLCLASLIEAKPRSRRRAPAKTAWEYNVVSILRASPEQRRSILNTEGRQGWELMFVSDDQTTPGTINFYFKRARRRHR